MKRTNSTPVPKARIKEARAAGTSSSAGAMASVKELAEEAGSGFPRLLAPPRSRLRGMLASGRGPREARHSAEPGTLVVVRAAALQPPAWVEPQSGPCSRGVESED